MSQKKYAHPPALPVFFATEMWERYGFYVVQTLLALYLSLHFQWPDKQIYTLIGSFTALTYISPVLGGWIADNLIGQKRATFVGIVFLFASYLALSLQTTTNMLPLALAGIAVGTGLLKSNISSLLGNQYPEDAASRESGFTIFYMGITTGIILGTTIPSYVNSHYGWSTSFMSAAIGVLIGGISFGWGVYYYDIKDYHLYQYSTVKTFQAMLMILSLWFCAWLMIILPSVADSIFLTVIILSIMYLVFCIHQEPKEQAYQTTIILLLCIISVIFWAFYFQMFLSLTLFILRMVKPTLWGIPCPPPYYVALQSLGMIVFGSLMARHKIAHSHSQKIAQIGNKFLGAILLLTLAYALISWVAHMNLAIMSLLSPLWMIPAYLLISLAELLLSPVGLCAITLLSSRNRVSTMMGIFFVSLGVGAFISGKLAKLTALPNTPLRLSEIKDHYGLAFMKIFWILVVLTLFCIGLNYIIRRLIRKLHEV